MVGDDDEVFLTRSLSVTPKTTEQHLIVRSGRHYAILELNARNDDDEWKTPLEIFHLLKLTTDGHKASRGLSATAELLVFHSSAGMPDCSIDIGGMSVRLSASIRPSRAGIDSTLMAVRSRGLYC